MPYVSPIPRRRIRFLLKSWALENSDVLATDAVVVDTDTGHRGAWAAHHSVTSGAIFLTRIPLLLSQVVSASGFSPEVSGEFEWP